jgi:hypothetical protein
MEDEEGSKITEECDLCGGPGAGETEEGRSCHGRQRVTGELVESVMVHFEHWIAQCVISSLARAEHDSHQTLACASSQPEEHHKEIPKC